MAQPNTDSSRSSDSGRWRAENAELADREREEAERRDADERNQPRASDSERKSSALEAANPDQLWQRWWQIQASFVDQPRSAVAEAHALVGGIVDDLVRQLESQRTELEQRWSNGQEISTEDLRCDMQRYRDFLGRVLSKLDDTKS